MRNWPFTFTVVTVRVLITLLHVVLIKKGVILCYQSLVCDCRALTYAHTLLSVVKSAPGSLTERQGRYESNPAITYVIFLFALELPVVFFFGPVL